MNPLASTIPTRSNAGDDILADWFNKLRDAIVNLENFVGAGFIPWTQFSVANNVSVFTNVTGCVIDPTIYGEAEVDVVVLRKDNVPTTKYERRKFLVVSNGTTVADYADLGGAGDSGLTFQFTSAGQLQYKSGNLTGTISLSKLAFKIQASGVLT